MPLNQPIKQNGYQIIYFRCYPFRRYKFSLSLLQWLNQNARQFDLAHIHALFSPVTTFAATIARNRQLPYIIRPCGMLDPADLQKKKCLKQIYAALLERPNLAGAAAIHFTSKREAKISERFGLASPGEIAVSPDFVLQNSTNNIAVSQNCLPQDLVIPLGVKADFYSDLLQNYQVPVVLFMSRIEPKKGLDLLIPALESILADGINFNFILAGSNPQNADYETKIKQQIQNSSLGKVTTITGFVSGDAKVALLRKADLFVLPSYYENFGIAVAEAMAAGLPVAISDRVQISEDIEQAEAGWVAPLDVGAIAQAIAQALLAPEERQRRGLNGREYAKKYYNWENLARQTIDAYQHILSSIN